MLKNLTSGQGYDLIRNGHAAYQSIHIVSLNTSMVFSSLKLVSIKSYLIYGIAELLLVTFYDLK